MRLYDNVCMRERGVRAWWRGDFFFFVHSETESSSELFFSRDENRATTKKIEERKNKF